MKKVAVVTGGNRGLGFATCEALARQGMDVILTARDAKKGEEAVAKLAKQGLTVHFHPLDAANLESIQELKRYLEKHFKKLDVLVNNAGVFKDKQGDTFFDAKISVIEESFRTNVEGPLLLIQNLVPLMKGSGQIVNVSSGMGQLGDMGGGSVAYRISKTALNALTRISQADLSDTAIHVNSVCPGWVRTDMGGPNAHRSLEQGIDTIVWLANQGEDGPKGSFYRDRKEIPW